MGGFWSFAGIRGWGGMVVSSYPPSQRSGLVPASNSLMDWPRQAGRQASQRTS